jgi:hypothetical protein
MFDVVMMSTLGISRSCGERGAGEGVLRDCGRIL